MVAVLVRGSDVYWRINGSVCDCFHSRKPDGVAGAGGGASFRIVVCRIRLFAGAQPLDAGDFFGETLDFVTAA